MTRPRKVLHVIDSFDLGGAQTFLWELARYLDPARFNVEVAAMHGHGVFEPVFQESGIVTHSLSSSKWPPLYVPNFLKLIRKGNYDILHFHLFGANLCAKPLAIAAGHSAIIVHDQCNDASRDQNPLLLFADSLANRGASRVIAVSESVRSYLLEKEDLADSKVVMISNGIDSEMFLPASEEVRRNARASFGISTNDFVIGGVGRLVAQKNFALLLDAAAMLIKRNPSVRFVIAGNGPLENALKEQAAQLGISDKVHFLGHVTNRVQLYQVLDALVMPSDFEGTPMTLLEAMASGLPVVASSVDGIEEACTQGVDALLAPPRDTAKFVSLLEQVITSPELRSHLARNARQTILERFEIRKLVRRIEEIYEAVLAESGA